MVEWGGEWEVEELGKEIYCLRAAADAYRVCKMVSNQGASESLNPTHTVQGCSPTKGEPFPNSQWKILSTVHIHSLRFWSFLSLTNFILSSLTATAGSFGLLTLFTPRQVEISAVSFPSC